MLCKRLNGTRNQSLNGHVSCTDSTYIRGPFFAVYRRSDSGASNALDGNKIKEQDSLRFVPDVTLCNSYSASHGVTWVTAATYKNVLKPQGSWLYKQSGHVPHVTAYNQ